MSHTIKNEIPQESPAQELRRYANAFVVAEVDRLQADFEKLCEENKKLRAENECIRIENDKLLVMSVGMARTGGR